MDIAPASKFRQLISGNSHPISYLRVPPGDYYVDQSITLQPKVTYDFTGVRLVASVTKVTMFRLAGAMTKVIGGTYDSLWPRTKPKGANPPIGQIIVFGVDQPNFFWDSPEVRNVDSGVELWPGQWNTWINKAHATPDIRGDFLYMGGGDETVPRGWVVCTDCYLEDSEQEHGVRDSTVGFANGLFSGCYFRNTNNKEPFALRHSHDLWFDSCTFDGNLFYIGNSGPGEPPGQECFNLKFKDCRWMGGGYLQFDGNAHDISIEGGSIDIPDDVLAPGNEPVAILLNDVVHNIRFRNFTRYITRTTKPWYRNWTRPAVSDQQAGFDFDVSNQTVRLKDFKTRQLA